MDAAALSVFIRNFREAAPYIDYLRGKTLVVGIASGLLQPERFRSVAADLALVAGLGVRLAAKSTNCPRLPVFPRNIIKDGGLPTKPFWILPNKPAANCASISRRLCRWVLCIRPGAAAD